MDKKVEVMDEIDGINNSKINEKMFGNDGKEKMEKYGKKKENIDKID